MCIDFLVLSPPSSCSLGALYAKLIYPNISTTSQQPLLFNINNSVNGNLLIHKRLRHRRRLLGGSSHMNVKNPQIDEGHLQKRHNVWLIITASFVCVCVCVSVFGGRCRCCLGLRQGAVYLNRVTSRPHLASVLLY